MPIAQFIRFGLVGILNTAFSYATYALLLAVGLPYAIANLGALILGIGFSFRTQARLVFVSEDKKRFLRFVAAWALIYLVNIGLISAFLTLGMNAYLAGALALVPVVMLSFVVQKYFVFAPARSKVSTSQPDRIAP